MPLLPISSAEFEDKLRRAHLSTSPHRHIQELNDKYTITDNLDLRARDWLREVPAIHVEKNVSLSYTPKLYSINVHAAGSIYLSGSGITKLMPGTSAGKNNLGIGLDIEFCANLEDLEIITPGMVIASWSGLKRIHPNSKIGKNEDGISLVAKHTQLEELNMEFVGAVDICGTNPKFGEAFCARPDSKGISLYGSEYPTSMPPKMSEAILSIGGKQLVWEPNGITDQFEVEIF